MIALKRFQGLAGEGKKAIRQGKKNPASGRVESIKPPKEDGGVKVWQGSSPLRYCLWTGPAEPLNHSIMMRQLPALMIVK